MAKIQNKTIDEFRPQVMNANKHSQRGMGALESSMRKHGYIAPMTAAADGEIIDGSARIETSANVFGDDVLVVEHDGTKPIIMVRTDIASADTPEARAIGYEANRVAQLNLTWDAEVMLADLNAGVDLSGIFNQDELDALLAGLVTPEPITDPGAQIDKAEAEKLAEQYGTAPGQIWQLGRHKLACIDCTDDQLVRALIGDLKPAYVWADPPYGIEIVGGNGFVGGGKIAAVGKYAPIVGDDTTEAAERSSALYLSLYPDALQVWWGANYYANALPPTPCWIVWDKENTGNFADAELAWCSSPSAVRIFKHMWNGMLKDSEHGQRRVHPTQKPIELARWAFEKYGKAGDVIIDPFLGSGISVLAAEQLNDGRSVIGFELAHEYIAATIYRWETMTGQKAILMD